MVAGDIVATLAAQGKVIVVLVADLVIARQNVYKEALLLHNLAAENECDMCLAQSTWIQFSAKDIAKCALAAAPSWITAPQSLLLKHILK